MFPSTVMIASQVWFVVLTWLLLARSDSGTEVGLVLMASALPGAGLMLVGGAITDRRDPVKVLQMATAVLTGALAVATALEFTTGLGVRHLMVLAAVVGATDAFVWPAVTALIPSLAGPHRLDNAHAALQLCDQASKIASPVLAGLVLASADTGATLAIDTAIAVAALAASFALATVVRRRRLTDNTGGSVAAGKRARRAVGSHTVAHDLLEGFRFVRHQPDVCLGVVAAALLSLVTVGPVSVGGTLLAADRFGGPEALSVLLGAFGLGAVVGVVAAGRYGAGWRLRPVIVATFASVGVGFTGIGLAPTLWLAATVAVGTSVMWGVAGVVVMAATQRATPEAFHGRVAGLIGFAFMALDPVSQGLAGFTVQIGAAPLFVGSGVTAALVAVSLFFSPWSRRSPL